MSLDPNPVFRKMIVAWYESEPTCYIVIVSMLLVLLFGVAGVSVAASDPAYSSYIWVPGLLILFAALIILSCIIQIMNLYSDK
ncbi:MAG: hypothetical protein KKD44_15310 [Proteobacteria bacterium]|nr:hypothetical protein [Pseudomonadota bacterium]